MPRGDLIYLLRRAIQQNFTGDVFTRQTALLRCYTLLHYVTLCYTLQFKHLQSSVNYYIVMYIHTGIFHLYVYAFKCLCMYVCLYVCVSIYIYLISYDCYYYRTESRMGLKLSENFYL